MRGEKIGLIEPTRKDYSTKVEYELSEKSIIFIARRMFESHLRLTDVFLISMVSV